MINFNSVSKGQFFQNLSQRDGWILYSYNKAFEINKSFFGGVIEISEATGSGKVRLDDNAKLKTANNLANLVSQVAETLVSTPGFDDVQIQRVLERYKGVVTAKMQNPDLKMKTEMAYQSAIDSLQRARVTKTEWTSKAFIEKFAKSRRINRPNFKFHLKQETNGEITPYTSRKLFWIEKLLYGKATSSLEKISMMQNLEKLFIQQMPRIEEKRLNTESITTNIERLAGRMTRNMTDNEKKEIDAIVGKLKTRLQSAQVQIDKDRASDPLLKIWKGIKWTIFAPVRLSKWVAWDIFVYPLATKISVKILCTLDAWSASPLVPVARSVNAVASTRGYKAAKFVLSLSIRRGVKRTYNGVVSPAIKVAGLLAKGIFSIVRLPVSALNSYRQVTA